jgi:hypothetical protein
MVALAHHGSGGAANPWRRLRPDQVTRFNVDPLSEPLHDRLDRMIASGACPPVIVAAPDCYTRVGGDQYTNSSGTGRYAHRGRHRMAFLGSSL